MQIGTTRQRSHSRTARVSTAALQIWLMALAVCVLVIGAGSATVSNGQSGEEEFQRKMNELKKADNKSKLPGSDQTSSSATQGGEISPREEGRMNIGASVGTCQREYKRFTDTTELNLSVGTIFKTEDASRRMVDRAGGQSAEPEELRLALAATVNGKEPSAGTPKNVEWFFQSTAPRYRYHNEAEVLMIIDGERVKVGHAHALGGASIMGEVLERLWLRVPAKVFSRIIEGRDVEVKIGTSEFQLSADALKAMRAFATCAGLK